MRAKYCDGVTRRDFVRVGMVGGLGLSLSGYLRAAETAGDRKSTADAVIFLNLAGGPSHFETLDMKPEAPAETRGSFKPIDSALPGVLVSEYMPKTAQALSQVTLMRGISHSAGSHPLGQSYISTGNRPGPAVVYPSYGSVVTRELPGFPDLPSYVAVPKTEWNSGYMGVAYAPFGTGETPKLGQPFQVRGLSLAEGVTVDKVNRRQKLLGDIDVAFRDDEAQSQLLEGLDRFGQQAHSMITSKRAKAAFDVAQEPESIAKLFAGDEVSQSMLLSCRLIEYGVKFVTITNAGWDTHLKNFEGHQRLIPPMDHAFAATLEALRAKGLLERTLVIAMGEFGRTPRINSNSGRDHFPQVNWSLFAGGGVRAGQVLGGTNKAGTAPDDGTKISPDDIAASVYHALGIDPRTEYHTPTGRPVMLVPKGEVIDGLFG